MFTKASSAVRGWFGVILSVACAVLAGGLSVGCEAGEPEPVAQRESVDKVDKVDKATQPSAFDPEGERKRLAEIEAATETERRNAPRVRFEGVPRGQVANLRIVDEANARAIVNVAPDRAALFVPAVSAAEHVELAGRQAVYAEGLRRERAALVKLGPEERERRIAEIKRAAMGR